MKQSLYFKVTSSDIIRNIHVMWDNMHEVSENHTVTKYQY